MTRRIQYRTPDGITHLWTQEEIDAHIRAMNIPVIDMPPHAEKDIVLHVERMGRDKLLPFSFENDPVSIQEEAALTVKMLYDLLYRPYKTIDHETVQDLLSRIDVMAEPLKELVQAMEVK